MFLLAMSNKCGTHGTRSRQLLRAPERVWPKAWVSPRVKEGGEMVRQVAKSYLPAPIVVWKKHKHGLLLGLLLFWLVAQPL
jgi:hypothetical protein